MGLARREQRQPQSQNRPDYQSSFVCRVHRIISIGYRRLNPPAFAKHKEEDITGELARAMQEGVQDAGAPRWAKHFWPSEETRVHEPGRLGKRRLRIDIEVMQHGLAARPRFRCEAKRLHDADSRREYLGYEGLGRFLDGRYAKEDEIAGMLGYVQAGSVHQQAIALERSLEAERETCGVRQGGEWSACPVVENLSTFRSIHERAGCLPPITLLHTLLLFC